MLHPQTKCGQQLERGEMVLFSFPSTSGGEELRGAALDYIPDVVLKVVELLEENQRLGVLKAHTRYTINLF